MFLSHVFVLVQMSRPMLTALQLIKPLLSYSLSSSNNYSDDLSSQLSCLSEQDDIYHIH